MNRGRGRYRDEDVRAVARTAEALKPLARGVAEALKPHLTRLGQKMRDLEPEDHVVLDARVPHGALLAGLLGNRGQVNYSAAKAGLHGATKALALEVASRGITVNAVAPGLIESPMLADAFPPDRIKQLVPLGRAGRPEEVAATVGFLCSESAAYISGQVISVDGAMT